MKSIKLAQPTTIKDELRHPIEGSLIVSDDEATRLKDNNLLDGEPEDLPEEASDFADEDLDGMSVTDLHLLVTKEGVPLNGASKKADIIAAIEKHRAEQAA